MFHNFWLNEYLVFSLTITKILFVPETIYYDYVSLTGQFFILLWHQYHIVSFVLFSLLFPTVPFRYIPEKHHF